VRPHVVVAAVEQLHVVAAVVAEQLHVVAAALLEQPRALVVLLECSPFAALSYAVVSS
jgi:hypothetical protein